VKVSAKADYALRASLRPVLEYVSAADVARGELPKSLRELLDSNSRAHWIVRTYFPLK